MSRQIAIVVKADSTITEGTDGTKFIGKIIVNLQMSERRSARYSYVGNILGEQDDTYFNLDELQLIPKENWLTSFLLELHEK